MNTPMKKAMQVLLADDNADDIILISEAIEATGVGNVDKFFINGKEVVEYLRACRNDEEALPDLVLLDINMPILNGLEAATKIRVELGISDVPIVILTSSDREEDVAAVYEAQANLYARKPDEFDQLRKLMLELMERFGV